MIGNYLLYICWGTAVLSPVWYYTAFCRPGFIGRFHRKGYKFMVGICAGITAFLFFMFIVAVALLIEHYRFM